MVAYTVNLPNGLDGPRSSPLSLYDPDYIRVQFRQTGIVGGDAEWIFGKHRLSILW